MNPEDLTPELTLSHVLATRLPASIHSASQKPNLFSSFFSCFLQFLRSLWLSPFGEGGENRQCVHLLHEMKIRHSLYIQYLYFKHTHLPKEDVGTCRTQQGLALTTGQNPVPPLWALIAQWTSPSEPCHSCISHLLVIWLPTTCLVLFRALCMYPFSPHHYCPHYTHRETEA